MATKNLEETFREACEADKALRHPSQAALRASEAASTMQTLFNSMRAYLPEFGRPEAWLPWRVSSENLKPNATGGFVCPVTLTLTSTVNGYASPTFHALFTLHKDAAGAWLVECDLVTGFPTPWPGLEKLAESIREALAERLPGAVADAYRVPAR